MWHRNKSNPASAASHGHDPSHLTGKSDIACASSPSVNFLALTSGVTDDVTVEVWATTNCVGTSLGAAAAKVTVLTPGNAHCPAGSLTLIYAGVTYPVDICGLRASGNEVDIDASFRDAPVEVFEFCGFYEAMLGSYPIFKNCHVSIGQSRLTIPGQVYLPCGGDAVSQITYTGVGATVAGTYVAHMCDSIDPTITLDVRRIVQLETSLIEDDRAAA